jgi:filamentous hemagglutinin
MIREAPMDQEQARDIADRISRGHAFRAHVIEGEDFPEIRTRGEFAEMIRTILTDPTSARRLLRDGREAIWSDVHRTVVIVDGLHEDGGTAFRPTRGRAYFQGLR